MMIFSLVAMTGLDKCCITSAYLQWLCHSGERPVARGPLVDTETHDIHFEFSNYMIQVKHLLQPKSILVSP